MEETKIIEQTEIKEQNLKGNPLEDQLKPGQLRIIKEMEKSFYLMSQK